MESPQVKINELDKWRNMEKNVPTSLPMIKTYGIGLCTLAMSECHELTSKFEEKARKNLAGMMDLYEKSIYDVQRYIQWPDINFRDEHLASFSLFQEIEDRYKRIKA